MGILNPKGLGFVLARRAFLYLLIVGMVCAACTAWAGTVHVRYRFGTPKVTPAGNGHRVELEPLPSLGGIGKPVLPVQTARILLPSSETVTGISVVPSGRHELPGTYRVEYGRQPVPSGAKPPVMVSPDPSVYLSSAPYPQSLFSIVSEQVAHGRRVLVANLYPVQYIPSTGRLVHYETLVVSVETTLSTDMTVPPHRSLKADSLAVDNKVDTVISNATAGPAQYLLITSEELASAFQPLIDWKERKGLRCRVVAVEMIDAVVTGRDRQEKVRNLIRDCYENQGTEYVLLAGGHEIIPTRGVYGSVGSAYLDKHIPCDLYYGALDGSWDGDSDGIYGEPHDGKAGGEIDLLAEVFVGRAPVRTFTEAVQYVAKTLAYEQDPGPNLSDLVWVGERLDGLTFGSESKETIAQSMPPGYHHTRLYERDNTFSRSAVLSTLNASPHMVNHLGHADEAYALGISMNDVSGFTNAHPFFVYSQGCYSGAFDAAYLGYNCIGSEFVAGQRGAFAGIFNSRYGWYTIGDATTGPSHYFDSEFYKEVFQGSLADPGRAQLGRAHQRAKENLIGTVGDSAMRWCYLELNLFGDPELSIYTVLAKGTVGLDRPRYKSSASAAIRLADYDLNADHTCVETVAVRVRSDLQPSGLEVVLTETGPSTGAFTGSVQLALTADSGGLQVRDGGSMTVVYSDADDGTGHPAQATCTAAIDDTPPAITQLMLDSVHDTSAVVSWITDEPSDTCVRYGLAGSQAETFRDGVLTTRHCVRIKDLSPKTRYWYSVESTDEAGNRSAISGVEMLFNTTWATTVFTDRIEFGGPAYRGLWKTSTLFGDVQPWERAFWVVHSIYWSWQTDDPPERSAVALDTPEIDLSNCAAAELTFYHRMLSELNYDGGFVQVSADCGVSWQNLEEWDLVKGTPFRRLGSTCPTPGVRGWTGDIPWENARLDISDYCGRKIIIRFRYESDEAVDVGGRDGWFIDDVSVLSLHGTILLDKTEYKPGDVARVWVYDKEPPSIPYAVKSVPVKVTSGTEQAGEMISAWDSRIYPPRSFIGVIGIVTGVPKLDGKLQVVTPDRVTATYSAKTSAASVTALIDGAPPAVRNVGVIDIMPDRATVVWDTDEPSRGSVSYGLNAGLGMTAFDDRFRTHHAVTVTGLQRTSIYYFNITSIDRAGNRSVHDNQGRLYTFVSEGFRIGGRITEDTVLAAIPGHPWLVTEDMTVPAGVKLTIEPGCVLKFGKGGASRLNASLMVSGSLIARGTTDKPIVFTSVRDDSIEGDSDCDGGVRSPAVGDWGAIGINADAPGEERVLEYCHFRYGGSDGGLECSAIECRNCRPTIAHCVFERNSFAIGLRQGARPMASDIVLLHNRFNGIWLRPGSSNTDFVLDITEAPYVLWSPVGQDFVVPVGRRLTIMPGVVVKLGGPGSDVSNSSMILGGSVRARGTADRPVVFTSMSDDSVGGDTDDDGGVRKPVVGDWGRLAISNSDSLFEHCIFRYGGRDEGKDYAAVECSNASPGFRYCAVGACIGGIRSSAGSPTVANCTIAANRRWGVSLDRGCTGVIVNSVVAFTETGCGIQSTGSAPAIAFTDVFGSGISDWCGLSPGFGCISSDPLFRDCGELDLRLRDGSPCIDSGDPAAVDPETTSRSDMGAYPFTPSD